MWPGYHMVKFLLSFEEIQSGFLRSDNLHVQFMVTTLSMTQNFTCLYAKKDPSSMSTAGEGNDLLTIDKEEELITSLLPISIKVACSPSTIVLYASNLSRTYKPS